MRRVTSEESLDELGVDSIVGKGAEVYQRILPNDEVGIACDGFGGPCVWAGIAFDSDAERLSTAGVWYRLAECEMPFRHEAVGCSSHRWVDVYHVGSAKLNSSDGDPHGEDPQ